MAVVLTDKETEKLFGITKEQLDQWDEDASNGIFRGEPVGPVVYGRTLESGEAMQQVGLEDAFNRMAAIDERARQLGMTRSEYLRHLVDEGLKKPGIA